MLSDIIDFIQWFLVVSVVGILALPITFRVFRFLPDRGYCFSKILGILLIGWVYWMLGCIGLLPKGVGGIFGATGIVVGLGIVWLGRAGWIELREFLNLQARTIFAVEIFFLVAFAGWTLIRAYNPSIVGTEKPMEFMFMNSILRSSSFIPHDAWLSGHAISYYYFGYFLITCFIQVTGTLPEVSFNLGLALMFALSSVGAFGIAMNLIAMMKRTLADQNNKYDFSLAKAFAPALLAPVFLLLVSNFYGVFDLAYRRGSFANANLPVVYYDFGIVETSNLDGKPVIKQMPGVRFGLVNFWEWLDLKMLNVPPEAQEQDPGWAIHNWFFSARAIHDRNLLGFESELITETPAFSFLLGDLHPHVLALPFGLLSMGLAIQWLLCAYYWSSKALSAIDLFHTEWQFGLVSAITLGGLIFLNTWDFPIYAFLCSLGVICGVSKFAGRLEIKALKAPLFFLAGVFGASFLFYWPYLITAQSQINGILPNLYNPTRFQQFVVMFGPLLFGLVLLIIAIKGDNYKYRLAWLLGLGILGLLILASTLLAIIAILDPEWGTVITSLLGPLSINQSINLVIERRLVDSLTSLSLTFFLVTAINRLISLVQIVQIPSVKRSDMPQDELDWSGMAKILSICMLLTGTLLVLGPEFLYIWDSFAFRMNTVFKLYFQAWALWSIAGTIGIWILFHQVKSIGRILIFSGTALVIFFGGLFLYGGLLSKTNGFAGPPTLDGMAYFAEAYPDDWAAVKWLNENVKEPTVILEGSRGSYWLNGRSSRISMITGLPTVIGWIGHEMQWRGNYYKEVEDRPFNIQQIYHSRDWNTTSSLLDQYEIEYVILSPLEREWYQAYQPKFEIHMRRVFESGELIIYQR